MRSVTSSSPDGYDIDEDDANVELDDCILEESYSNFEKSISKLPAHFRHLAEHINEDDFAVDVSDSLVDEYLSDPPGHCDPDNGRDSDEQSLHSVIDAFFQR